MTDLKTLALAAKDGWNPGAWFKTHHLEQLMVDPPDTKFIEAASPDAILNLLAERDRLREALKDAAQSLETIASLAGRKTFNIPPVDTCMGHFDQVRGYAASRAGVARQALGAQSVQEPPPDPQLCKFYSVETYPALVEAQARHIEKLQAKLPNTTGTFTVQKVREG